MIGTNPIVAQASLYTVVMRITSAGKSCILIVRMVMLRRSCSRHGLLHTWRRGWIIGAKKCQQVFAWYEASSFDETGIVRRIVRRLKDRGAVKAVHEDATVEFVGGQIDGAAQERSATLTDPGRRCLQEGSGHLSVVQAFKQAKEASLLVMVLIVGVVDDRGNTADDFRSLSRQEELHCGMLKKGILPGMRNVLRSNKERGDPMRIASIDLPGNLRKALTSRGCRGTMSMAVACDNGIVPSTKSPIA